MKHLDIHNKRNIINYMKSIKHNLFFAKTRAKNNRERAGHVRTRENNISGRVAERIAHY